MAAKEAIDFRVLFDCVPTPLMVVTRDITIVDMNQHYLDVVGRTRDELIGRNLFEAFPAPSEAERMLRDSFETVIDSRASDFLSLIRYPVTTQDQSSGSDRYWSASHVPICDTAGEVAYILQNTQDVTELRRAKPLMQDAIGQDAAGRDATALGKAKSVGSLVFERAQRVQALNTSLLRETAQLRNLFMRAPSFMCVLRGPDHRFELANTAFLSLIGKRELIGLPIREAIPEATGQMYLDLLDTVYRSGEPFVGKQMRAEFARTGTDAHDEVFIDFVFQPIFGDEGQSVGIFVDGNDVTDHVRAEKSQAMLVRELHHRVRNTLATVQGVMNSTARTAESIEDYQWAFSGRISSLARTHSLLTEEIQQFVSFPNLLRQEVGAYADGAQDRVVLEGPDVELPSQLAVPLGMTIHELTTNALRHGALSSPRGKVTVTWTIVPAKEKRILICRWVESGGPTVAAPVRHGFGSMILTRVLSQQIGAKVEVAYPVDGFTLTTEIPLDIERL